MTDQQLRALVRDVIAERSRGTISAPPDPEVAFRAHASHAMLPLHRGSEGDGACLIEPSVRCIHCGYCTSYGH
jgi:hypothetical protein